MCTIGILHRTAAAQNPMEFLAVATEAETGKTKYFTMADVAQDDYSVMKASSAIPFICRPYPVGETLYFDGALADPVPVEKAFSLGCDKVVVLLTLPEDTVRSSERDRKLAVGIRRKYPLAAEQLLLRAKKYNDAVALARRYAREGKALIVAPDDTCGVSTLCRDADALNRLYEKGVRDGEKLLPFMG